MASDSNAPARMSNDELGNFVPVTSGEQLLSGISSDAPMPVGADPFTGVVAPHSKELNRFGEKMFYTRTTASAEASHVVASGSVAGGVVEVVDDFFLGKRVALPSGGSVIYGVTVRLRVKASNFDSKLEVSLPVIAAEAQFGRTTAHYDFEVVGYRPPEEEPNFLPKTSGSFNLDMYVDLIGSAQRMRNRLFTDRSGVDPEPILIERPPVGASDTEPFLKASPGLIFGLSRLARERTRSQFLSQLEHMVGSGKFDATDEWWAKKIYDHYAGDRGDISHDDAKLINLTYFARFDIDVD